MGPDVGTGAGPGAGLGAETGAVANAVRGSLAVVICPGRLVGAGSGAGGFAFIASARCCASGVNLTPGCPYMLSIRLPIPVLSTMSLPIPVASSIPLPI